MQDFVAKMRKALAFDHPYWDSSIQKGLEKRMAEYSKTVSKAPGNAAVLAVFGKSEKDRAPHILLTQRTQTVESHKGQIAFPGGMVDVDDSDLQATALRETEEEVGLGAQKLEVLGRLPVLATLATYTWITPYVAFLYESLEKTELRLSADEIDQHFWLPWPLIISGEIYSKEWFETTAGQFQTHVYKYHDFRIWGATAAMIKNLADRWNSL